MNRGSAPRIRPVLWLLLALAAVAYAATVPVRGRWARERAERKVHEEKSRGGLPTPGAPSTSPNAAREDLQSLQRQVRGRPDDALLYLRMAPLYDALGEGAQARHALQAARWTAPRDANVAAALGAAYEERAVYDRAIEEWRRALRLAPGNNEVTLALVSLYVSLGWSVEARALLESARRRAPEDPGILIAMAMERTQSASTRAAEEHLRAAKRLAPEDGRIDSLLSHVYDLEGRPADAMAAIRRALDKRPDEADYLIQLGDLLLAGPGGADAHQAEEAYRRALRVAAGDPRAVLGLGRALRRQERFAEAAEVLAPLAGRPRPDPAPVRELGQVQSRLGRTNEAQSSLARAERLTAEAETLQRAQMQVAMRPGSPERRRQLSALYLEQGDAPRAIVELKRVLEQRPADGAARELLQTALRQAGREDEVGTR